MNNGSLLCNGTVPEIFSDPAVLLNAGLDVPEITKVAMLLAEKGYASETPIYTVEHAVEFIINKLNGG